MNRQGGATVARVAHNHEEAGSIPAPATKMFDVATLLRAKAALDSANVPFDTPRSLVLPVSTMKRAGMTIEQIDLAMREKGYKVQDITIYGYDPKTNGPR